MLRVVRDPAREARTRKDPGPRPRPSGPPKLGPLGDHPPRRPRRRAYPDKDRASAVDGSLVLSMHPWTVHVGETRRGAGPYRGAGRSRLVLGATVDSYCPGFTGTAGAGRGGPRGRVAAPRPRGHTRKLRERTGGDETRKSTSGGAAPAVRRGVGARSKRQGAWHTPGLRKRGGGGEWKRGGGGEWKRGVE